MSTTATRLRQIIAARAAQAAREAAKADAFKVRPPLEKWVRVAALVAQARSAPDGSRAARVAQLFDAAAARMPDRPTHTPLPIDHWA